MWFEFVFVFTLTFNVISYPYAPDGNYQVVLSRTRGNTLVENGLVYATPKTKSGISYQIDDDHIPNYTQQPPHAGDYLHSRRNQILRRPQTVDSNGMVYPSTGHGVTIFRPGGFHYSSHSQAAIFNQGNPGWKPNAGHAVYTVHSTPPPFGVYQNAGYRPTIKNDSSYRPKSTTTSTTKTFSHHSSEKPQQHQYQYQSQSQHNQQQEQHHYQSQHNKQQEQHQYQSQSQPNNQQEQHQYQEPELKPIFTSVQKVEEGEQLIEDSVVSFPPDLSGIKADDELPPSSTGLPVLYHTLDENPILNPVEKIAISIELPTFNYNSTDDDTTRAPLKRPTLTTSSTTTSTTTSTELPETEETEEDIKPR
ncbi:CLUMA_CG010663, isoform A [Clunio marinus]|uniref:CLUMA_CG010663, isoform A n=1 Tax=Clunio marinus TaxID=568069 RepID=A0A1J1IAM5_9DIPT|nr:CLUMA_CG010663, isoform A [Clunio marinus]